MINIKISPWPGNSNKPSSQSLWFLIEKFLHFLHSLSSKIWSSFPSWSLCYRNKTFSPFPVIKLYDNIWRCSFKIQLIPYSKPWRITDLRVILLDFKNNVFTQVVAFEIMPDNCYQMLNFENKLARHRRWTDGLWVLSILCSFPPLSAASDIEAFEPTPSGCIVRGRQVVHRSEPYKAMAGCLQGSHRRAAPQTGFLLPVSAGEGSTNGEGV